MHLWWKFGGTQPERVFFAEGDSATPGIRSPPHFNGRQNKRVALVFWGGEDKDLGGLHCPEKCAFVPYAEITKLMFAVTPIWCVCHTLGFSTFSVALNWMWLSRACACSGHRHLVVFSVCFCKINRGKGEAGVGVHGVCSLNIQVIAEVVQLHPQTTGCVLYWQHSTQKIL